MKKRRLLTLIVMLVFIMTMTTGCFESFKNKMDNQGGFIESAGDYIIVNSSGGIIQDVWKLKDSFVNSVDNSDGWMFTDNNGDSVTLGGDAKLIRVKSATTWDSYKEYHIEIDDVSYQEFKNQ